MADPIVIFSDGIPPYVMGGMQKHSRYLVEYLARNEQDVVLYHYLFDGEEIPTEDEVLSLFSETARKRIRIRTFRYEDKSWIPGHYLRSQKKMSQVYRDDLKRTGISPRLVYAKGFMGDALLRSPLPEMHKFKVGVKFHGINMFQIQPDWKGEFTKYMFRGPVRRIMNRADFVFSYGGKITTVIEKELKDTSKIVELPSGIESDWIRSNYSAGKFDRTIRCLFVGRFDRLKGLPELFDAIVSNPDLDLSLSVVGPIPAEVVPSDSRITALGAIHDAEVLKKIYDDHDVLVCPSISEGMPNVILEAMARGLAILATDVGATSALVDSENGWLIEPKNKTELVKALHEVSRNGELGKMGGASINRVRSNFDWERISHQFINWLESIELA